jgi:hypothetical protein
VTGRWNQKKKVIEILNFTVCKISFLMESTTPTLIRLHLRCFLIRVTPPVQVFHPDIEQSEIIGKGSLFSLF